MSWERVQYWINRSFEELNGPMGFVLIAGVVLFGFWLMKGPDAGR